MRSMTKIERIDAALKGQAVDLVPISFWRHFHLQERDAGLLADALLAYQREYQWDFVKVNPRASYHAEAWGNRYSYSDDPHTPPTRVSHVVHSGGDWAKIGVLDVFGSDPLKQQLVLLELMKEGLQDENVYFLQTVFSPLAVAYRLAGHSKERLAQAMEQEGKELHAALEAIAESLTNYVGACIDAGASGIFFSPTRLASSDVMTEQQYEEYGAPYDLQLLAAVKDRPGFNLLHLCGDNVFFQKLMGYPVDAISWDATLPGNPSLREGKERSGKMVVGGVSHTHTLETGSAELVAQEVARGIEQTGGRGYVIGPGCVYSTRVKREMLEAALEARSRFGSG